MSDLIAPSSQQQGVMFADVPFAWTTESRTAALCFAGVLLAPSERTVPRIARTIGVPVSTIRLWRNHPEFQMAINEYSTRASEALMRYGLAQKEQRIAAAATRHALLSEVIEARQEWAAENAVNGTIIVNPEADDEDQRLVTIPGLESGMIVLEEKTIGSGMLQERSIAGKIDSALLNEMRMLEQAIAREKGEYNPDAQVNLDIKLYQGIDLDKV